jgi:hypothetical protein
VALAQACMQMPLLSEMHSQPAGQSALAAHSRVQMPPGKPPPVRQMSGQSPLVLQRSPISLPPQAIARVNTMLVIR